MFSVTGVHWEDPSPTVFPSPVSAVMSPSPGHRGDRGAQHPIEVPMGTWVLHTSSGVCLLGGTLLNPLGWEPPDRPGQLIPPSQIGALWAAFVSPSCAALCPSSLRLPRCPPTSAPVLASYTRVQASPMASAVVPCVVGTGVHEVGHQCPLAGDGDHPVPYRHRLAPSSPQHLSAPRLHRGTAAHSHRIPSPTPFSRPHAAPRG